jgi:hypothetical protein
MLEIIINREKNVISILRSITVILFYILCIKTSIAKDKNGINSYYFLLEETTKPNYHKVNLNAKELYQKDLNVELFNFFLDSSTLIVFSVLPSIDGLLWNKVNAQDLSERKLSLEDISNSFALNTKNYLHSNKLIEANFKRDDIAFIIKKGNNYYQANYCLIEYFKVLTQPMIFPNLMSSYYLNIKSPAFKIEAFEEQSFKINKEYSINAPSQINFSVGSRLRVSLEKPLMFFSMSFTFKNYTAHQFWIFTDWRFVDNLNVQRGSDRLVYLPKVGIIGASYDYWFAQFVKRELLLKNYFQEKVMLTDKL